MASPAVSTSSSAGSPAAIAPAPPTLAIKAATPSTSSAIPSGSGTSTPGMITRKEWVIPPRPKPGRKPATDTPPTKRKAQNRAAQRAFRERRAARVGELEEQLEETKEETQKRENDLRAMISKLEADVERFSGEVNSWRLRCDTLDRIAEYERREKEAALAELAYLRNGSRTTGTDAVPLPPRHLRQQEPKVPEPQQQFVPEPEPASLGCGGCTSSTNCACVEQALAISQNGCGKCTPDTHCECLEETIKCTDLPTPLELKRSHSPSTEEYADKRLRSKDPSTPLEMDFTAQFSKPAINVPPEPVVIARPHGESCGFCEEGTYCMCAEAAAAPAANNERDHENRLAPLLNAVTPPPSDSDVDGTAIKLPSLQPNPIHRPLTASAPASSCVNGPGTCQQCQADPKSGLFCRSLAALRASSTSGVPEGCCGGNAGGGGCCKSLPTAAPSEPPPSLSCADTYKTLATHKNFDQASDELSTWLGRLHATPPAHPGRAPMEVEAASVMGVLKLFDRRFGRG
ncbi:uncharacterized protein LY89DRAFT_692329 [Mollisia scopiformis]|uniref:BZIP domain-containing protein n=1 Tax=Mollisia scopiformis TaxID=149040 RepID=A0A132B2T4_MOLSC|nr:uncharacterized protein LY89DRAFT_692329 [Mollisia scopiformis]KUJ06718.1 hypothetical protein LY89DRAFT_692329 [Mollisia scopiformis]